jgi:citrate lyase beta subunit
MRHFAYLNADDRDRLFAVAPEPVTPNSPREIIALALGGTLYSPGTRATLDRDSLKAASIGGTSMVWCLEDAIRHEDVPQAEQNVVEALRRVHAAGPQAAADYPLLFVRVRTADQIRRIAAEAGEALNVLTGFSLPKMTTENAHDMLCAVRDASAALQHPLYAMPILETPDIAYIETRRDTLRELAAIFDEFRTHVLCIRVGGTDLSGLFGLRRDRDTTIWDVAVVRDALSDILNQFARNGDYVVTGAVWEHIPGPRLFKPRLRESPFQMHHNTSLRMSLIKGDVDSLMREISKDRNNGMYGKTVIHPTHVSIVNSMLTVSRDEYDDALAIKSASHHGGVIASDHGRMNEMGPHSLWAEQICARAAVYGVLTDQNAWVDLLELGQEAVVDIYPSASTEKVSVG